MLTETASAQVKVTMDTWQNAGCTGTPDHSEVKTQEDGVCVAKTNDDGTTESSIVDCADFSDTLTITIWEGNADCSGDPTDKQKELEDQLEPVTSTLAGTPGVSVSVDTSVFKTGADIESEKCCEYHSEPRVHVPRLSRSRSTHSPHRHDQHK